MIKTAENRLNARLLRENSNKKTENLTQRLSEGIFSLVSFELIVSVFENRYNEYLGKIQKFLLMVFSKIENSDSLGVNFYFFSENDFEVFDNWFRVYFYFDFWADRQWYDRVVSRRFSENFLNDRR